MKGDHMKSKGKPEKPKCLIADVVFNHLQSKCHVAPDENTSEAHSSVLLTH